MKPRQKKVRAKLMIFFLIFLKTSRGPVIRDVYIFSLLILHYTGEGRFVRETKEELEDEEEDETEMAKSSLTENDENDGTQNDESEGYYVLLINLVP